MVVDLKDYRLVFVAPARGKTAVGDYSEDFLTGVRQHFGEVAEIRCGSPGDDGIADARRARKAVRNHVAAAPHGRVLVHAELAAGGFVPFWSVVGLRGVPVTATIHDPPQGVWWPWSPTFMHRSRLVFHGLHFTTQKITTALEGRVYTDRTLIALTETGRRSIEQRYPQLTAVHIPHIVRDRPTIRPAQERPKAIGFFGHVYRGKGFEQIEGIRRQLADDVAIRVAGRGTETLPREHGIEILGAVDGLEEDAFFESVRAIVVPYGKRHWQDVTYPASGVVAHAMAYRTPIVTTGYGSLAELDTKAGAVVVPVDHDQPDAVATELARAITELVNDKARLTELGEYSEKTRQDRSAPRTAEEFAAVWSRILAQPS
ncbi:glycosyltransferase [Mycobacterium sp. NPDC048908]|uniref:glycosyltransferase n=1 Tax=Mycobacterium sp. NPDC048908 TaxID=3364292 RepID=UPI00371B6E92